MSNTQLTKNDLTKEQQQIIDKLIAGVEAGIKRQLFGGPAGTGKTAASRILLEQLQERFPKRPIFAAAPTNKAVNVLKSKVGDVCNQVMTTYRLLQARPIKVNQEEIELLASDLKKEMANKYRFDQNKIDKKERDLQKMIDDSLTMELNESKILDENCIVLHDESSMLEDSVALALEATGAQIIYVGDDYQLQPVRGDKWFIVPQDMMFTQVHRQAEGSGILDIATSVRWQIDKKVSVNSNIRTFINEASKVEFNDVVFKRTFQFIHDSKPTLPKFKELAENHDQMICYRRNDPSKGAPTLFKTSSLNNIVRTSIGNTSPYPVVGERIVLTDGFEMFGEEPWYTGDIITIKSPPKLVDTGTPKLSSRYEISEGEARRRAINAGAFICDVEHETLGYFTDVAIAPTMVENKPQHLAHLLMEGRQYEDNPINACVKGQYAAVMTGHVAQGSQWDRVCVFVDLSILDYPTPNYNWLYTAITRAAKHLTIVIV